MSKTEEYEVTTIERDRDGLLIKQTVVRGERPVKEETENEPN